MRGQERRVAAGTGAVAAAVLDGRCWPRWERRRRPPCRAARAKDSAVSRGCGGGGGGAAVAACVAPVSAVASAAPSSAAAAGRALAPIPAHTAAEVAMAVAEVKWWWRAAGWSEGVSRCLRCRAPPNCGSRLGGLCRHHRVALRCCPRGAWRLRLLLMLMLMLLLLLLRLAFPRRADPGRTELYACCGPAVDDSGCALSCGPFG